MRTAELVVLFAGVGAIVWVNWYFFFAQRRAVLASSTPGVQEVQVAVKGGYEPGVVRAKRGVPLRMVFDRQETSSCSEELVIPAFGIRRFLPPFERTAIEFTPGELGTFDITCGMSMLHAKLVVED